MFTNEIIYNAHTHTPFDIGIVPFEIVASWLLVDCSVKTEKIYREKYAECC